MINQVKADPVFYKRQSPRDFTDQRVPEEILMTLFEAARWAPSSFNEQPWRFIYAIKHDASTKERYDKLLSCLNDRNRHWAFEAPVLFLTAAKTNFGDDEKTNRHAWHDVGLAMGNLCMQATKMGLVVHQMAGFSAEKATEVFELPGNMEPVAMVAVGYTETQKTDRSRKPLQELML